MADDIDLELAAEALLKDYVPLDEVEYWKAKYWQMQDEYDMMVSELETIVREAK